MSRLMVTPLSDLIQNPEHNPDGSLSLPLRGGLHFSNLEMYEKWLTAQERKRMKYLTRRLTPH